MGLFGKKNNNKDNDNNDNNLLQGDDLDALIMSAIEETDLEQAQEKEQARKNEAERVARMTEQLNAAAAEAQNKKVVRRSFLMVTASERDGETFRLKGTLHGEMKVDDTVYLYHPNGTAAEAKITEVISGSDEDTENIDMTKGIVVRISVVFNSEVPEDALAEEFTPHYSVITNVKPPLKDDPKAPVENPFLLGLSLEYPNYMKDKEFMHHILKAFAEGRFVVPIYPSEPAEQGKKPVLKLITLKNPEEGQPPIVPIFSDVAALVSWRQLMEKGKPSVALLPFAELAKITAKDRPAFALNPAGPITINIPRDIVDNISNLVRKVGGIHPNQKVPRVAIGVPPKNEETENIRSALVEYAKSCAEIKSLGFIATIKEGGRRGYACVVDCPKYSAKDLFQEMAEKIKPYMKDVKSMEFIIRADAKFADMYFSKIPYDYQE